MILDRIFGLIAAAAFALGIAAQWELLNRAKQWDPFDPRLITLFALAVIAVGYITLRAERKYGLIDPSDESVDLVEVAFSLPRWAIAVSAVLTSHLVLLIIGVREPSLLAQLPPELSILRPSLQANDLIATLVAFFTLESFVIAAYFLIRKPIKEFR